MSPSPLRELLRTVEEWFFDRADPRAYALLRILYAFAALTVMVDVWPFRETLLSYEGMFGGAFWDGIQTATNLFFWARSPGAVTVVMVASMGAALCLGLGVFQRASAVFVYLWAASYASTVPVAQSGFDEIIRVVGFAVAISPVVPTWTVSRKEPEDGAAAPPAYGLRIVQWQLLLIYVCTVWLKAPDPFWRRGEAIPYFLMSMFSRFPSPEFARMGALGALLTYGTLLVELGVPWLLWTRKTRLFGIALGLSLHVGIALVSKLALFTVAMLPLYAAFLETADFERVGRWMRKPHSSTSSASSAAKDSASNSS